jgi:hypothetical protein
MGASMPERTVSGEPMMERASMAHRLNFSAGDQ